MTNDENGNPGNVEATMPTDWMQQTFPAIRLACAAKEGGAQSTASMLQELVARMSDHQKFEVGQIVTWKPGLKNRKGPDYGQPMIVTAIPPASFPDPTEHSSGSPYFREPLSLVVGFCDDGDYLEFYIDGRRVAPVADPTPARTDD